MPRKAFSLPELDAFMAAQKRIVNPHVQTVWVPHHIAGEKIMSWLLEIGGEIHPHARIAVTASLIPRDAMFFRLQVLCPMALCRLDHTDEFHPNPLTCDVPGLPNSVEGLHLHPWVPNRRYFEVPPHSGAVELRIAVPFEEPVQSFGNALRWFCNQARIEPLPPNHVVELPDPDQLL
jgi:hypothetical protein